MQQTYSGSFFAFLCISIFAHPEEDLRGGEKHAQSLRQSLLLQFEAHRRLQKAWTHADGAARTAGRTERHPTAAILSSA